MRERGPADGPEDRPLSERCISYGAPRTGANYNSYVQIIQSPETVVLFQEMIHQTREWITITQRPHLPSHIRQLHGDPRGRWEGDSLVVETTNYINGFRDRRRTSSSPSAIPGSARTSSTGRSKSKTRRRETKPYTFMIRLKKTDGLIYEYACHEGNYAMEGILGRARREEAKGTKR